MIGRTLSHYKIIDELGSGGMGHVFKARDLGLDRDVAIKVLRQEVSSDPERLRRFEQEARAASGLNHPNIVTIYEIGREGTIPFIAMEYIDGRTLKEIISGGPLPNERLLNIATQAAEGLAKAHGAGIIHRDIKPANLMETADGFVKILDFGVAKLLTPASGIDSEAPTVTRTGTRAGVMLGTVSYMSPEQARGNAVDSRSDHFALGAVLYEMATGEPAFQRDTVAETFSAILRDIPPALDGLDSSRPSRFVAILKRCLAKDPTKRYDSTRDLAEDLRQAKEGHSENAFLQQRQTRSSIAVLPFAKMSADPEQEYFCDGMAEEILNALARVDSLRVIARTSSFVFKGKGEDARTIGRKLGVDNLLEGSVRKAGSRLRITAQLVDANDGSHMWSDRYDRQMEDVFEIQEEIASSIVLQLKDKLGVSEAPTAQGKAGNLGAYDACLRGRYHLQRFTEEDVRKAVACFEEAISKDDAFSSAHAGLAISYFYLYQGMEEVPPRDLIVKAKKAAQRALDLDSTSAEAHAALGLIESQYDWDRGAAERRFRRALELNPNYAKVYVYCAWHLTFLEKKYEETMDALDRAEDLDPFDLQAKLHRSVVHVFRRDFDEGREQVQKVIDLEPHFAFAHYWLGCVLMFTGLYEEAIPALDRAVTMGGRTAWHICVLGKAHARAGNETKARELLSELQHRNEQGAAVSAWLARLYAALDEPDLVFQWLERAYQERDVSTLFIAGEPTFDALRSDPRFQDLLRRMNLPG